jgi:hypothetical protein
MIRAATGSVYSHVGLVYLIEERRYCLEAVGKRVSLGLMSEVAKRYAGGIDYFEINAPNAIRHKATLFALEQLGKPFDFVRALSPADHVLSPHAGPARPALVLRRAGGRGVPPPRLRAGAHTLVLRGSEGSRHQPARAPPVHGQAVVHPG